MTSAADVLEPVLTTRSFRAIGTTATVVVQDPASADAAERMLAAELQAIDLACSRFRDDSELQVVHADAGRPVAVSPLLFEALDGGARRGRAHRRRRRPHRRQRDRRPRLRPRPRRGAGPPARHRRRPSARSPAIGTCTSTPNRTVRIPRGVRLDLGSTAKALAADRAAARIAGRIGARRARQPRRRRRRRRPAPARRLGRRHRPRVVDPGGARSTRSWPSRTGGLASSATAVRTWRAGDRDVHHIVDPRTGDCAEPYWDLVSATGASCVEANLVTTAAMVWGEQALDKLPRFDQAVRLVRLDGEVFSVNGWPQEEAP